MKVMKKIIISMVLLIVVININIIGVFAATSGNTEVHFFNNFEVISCIKPNAFESFWINTDGTSGDSRNKNPGIGCYQIGGWPEEDCCPLAASKCDRDLGICGPGPTSCIELTESECGGHFSLAENDLKDIVAEDGYVCNDFGDSYGPANEGCFKHLACACSWNNANKKCEAVTNHTVFDSTINYPNGTFYTDDGIARAACGAGNPGIGTCGFSFNRIDNCDTVGFIFRDWAATWTGITAPSYCKGGNDRVPCLDVVRLGFFNWINFIIVIFIIIAVYVFINKRK